LATTRAVGGRSKKVRGLSPLGPLEVDLLTLIWETEPATVRAVYETVRLRRPIAYTTCMTVMGSLVRKGFLAVDKGAIPYLYRVALPPEEVAGTVLDNIVAHLWRGDPGAALAGLLGLSRPLDERQRDDLRREARGRFGA
jgi:predicted transcriptional regulator